MNPDIIVFLDGDYSDYPEEMARIVAPIVQGTADLVIGSRMMEDGGKHVLSSPGILGEQAGNISHQNVVRSPFYRPGTVPSYTRQRIKTAGYAGRNFGWTIEMQIKAVKQGLSIMEVPVRYRTRIGTSKISGTVIGSIKAGAKILYTVFSHIF